MGIGKSAYEKNGRPNYIKLSEAEYKMIKNIWVDIENDPQFHGYSFFISFCDVYPQYIKFYTLDAHLSLTYDTRTTAKFTIIMETLGYLILDFYNKPKQQDRLIGSIINLRNCGRTKFLMNFGSHLLEYLTKTFPAKMTVSCKKILTKYFNNILDRIITKVEYFQNYEQEEADSERSLYRLCSCAADMPFLVTSLYMVNQGIIGRIGRSNGICG
ncbi:hypothetical protein KM043_011257 [Ampulex compressa]|nr:hypothetical protein KM043_011257 [Ampulex compressa]